MALGDAQAHLEDPQLTSAQEEELHAEKHLSLHSLFYNCGNKRLNNVGFQQNILIIYLDLICLCNLMKSLRN